MTANNREVDEQANGIDQVKKYIHQNTDQALDREQLATMAGYSLPHFHCIFTAEIGENIAAYIRRIRLERAAHKLMAGAVDLTEVAMAAGYQSHAAFSKAFKQRYGYTPDQFRKLNFMIALETVRKGKPHDKD
ncbi:MAG: AraC family transcriptional regulator [Chloroflexota bacterium]